MSERIERPLPMCSCGKPDTPGTTHRYWGQPCHETESRVCCAVAVKTGNSVCPGCGATVVAVRGRVVSPVAFIRETAIPVNPMGAWVEVLAERDAALAELRDARAELAAWDSAVADERDALLVENQALKRSVAFLSSELHDARHAAEFSPEKVDRAAHAMADHEGNINSYEYYEDWAEVMLRAALGPDGEAQ